MIIRFLILILCLNNLSLFAQSKERYLRNGNKLYSDSSYNDAEIEYRKSLEKDQNYFNASFNLADAVYKQNRFEEASMLFNSLVDNTNDKNQLSKLYHNLGNSQFKENKFEQAVESFKSSLRLNPDDDETRHNLIVAKNKLQ